MAAGIPGRHEPRERSGRQDYVDLRVDLSTNAGQFLITPRGKICYDNRELLRTAVEEALAEPEPRIVVDLGAVSMCDSSGLQIFLDTHRRAAGSGGWLRLADPQPLVQRVLSITQLSRFFSVFDSVESAASA